MEWLDDRGHDGIYAYFKVPSSFVLALLVCSGLNQSMSRLSEYAAVSSSTSSAF